MDEFLGWRRGERDGKINKGRKKKKKKYCLSLPLLRLPMLMGMVMFLTMVDVGTGLDASKTLVRFSTTHPLPNTSPLPTPPQVFYFGLVGLFGHFRPWMRVVHRTLFSLLSTLDFEASVS